MPYRHQTQAAWMLSVSVLLGACASAPSHGSASSYQFDTVTNACRTSPANCAAMAGRDVTLETAHAAATIGATVSVMVKALEVSKRVSIEEALVRCANLARSEVLIRHREEFRAPSPSAEECTQWVKDARGRKVTQAMKLGVEMHAVALRCAEEMLGTLRPGGFSLEPRYRHDPRTGGTKWVSPEEARALEQSGNGGELLGTLVPDVVIHVGDPLQVQAVYDFKFPCVNTDEPPRWGQYPDGHPYEDLNQGEVYEKVLGPKPARIVPRLGVVQ
jgi:hypothetical protein